MVFNFDRHGYARHARHFDPADLAVDLTGQRVAVTGASSGLGLETASALARLGAETWLLCRSEERGEAARAQVQRLCGHDRVHLQVVDLARPQSVHAAADALTGLGWDVVVHNAGVLPRTRTFTPEGLETGFATNVVGPMILTWRLRSAVRGRWVWVSSGGMYAARLDLDGMQALTGRYDGRWAYAYCKRAQLVLAELLVPRLAPSVVHTMHPGWADTPGVERSIPGFHRASRAILRTPAQGADTSVWLAAAAAPARCSGGFWFDRRPAPTGWHRVSSEDREALWALVEARCGFSWPVGQGLAAHEAV